MSMSMFLSLVARAEALRKGSLRNPEVEALVWDAIGAVLSLEGPPPFPLDGHYDWHIIRTSPPSGKVGQPRFVATTWTIGSWTCLLLGTRSVPMGRGQTITLANGRQITTPTDSATNTAMKYIGLALRHFGFHAVPGPCVFCINAGIGRTFFAWRPLAPGEDFEPRVKGDIDNIEKTIFDACQRHGLVRNDRQIAKAIGSKFAFANWDEPLAPLMDAMLSEEAAKLARDGMSASEIRSALGVTYAHLEQWGTEITAASSKSGHNRNRKSGKKARVIPEALRAKLAEGIRLMEENQDMTWTEAAIKVGVAARTLRAHGGAPWLQAAVAELLADRISVKEAARLARMSPQNLRHILVQNPETKAATERARHRHLEALNERKRKHK